MVTFVEWGSWHLAVIPSLLKLAGHFNGCSKTSQPRKCPRQSNQSPQKCPLVFINVDISVSESYFGMDILAGTMLSNPNIFSKPVEISSFKFHGTVMICEPFPYFWFDLPVKMIFYHCDHSVLNIFLILRELSRHLFVKLLSKGFDDHVGVSNLVSIYLNKRQHALPWPELALMINVLKKKSEFLKWGQKWREKKVN